MTFSIFKVKLTRAEDASTVCLWLGVLAMFTWYIPLLGLGMPVAGLIAGRRGWQAHNRDRARLGAVLCMISLGMGLLLLYWLTLFPNIEEF